MADAPQCGVYVSRITAGPGTDWNVPGRGSGELSSGIPPAFAIPSLPTSSPVNLIWWANGIRPESGSAFGIRSVRESSPILGSGVSYSDRRIDPSFSAPLGCRWDSESGKASGTHTFSSSEFPSWQWPCWTARAVGPRQTTTDGAICIGRLTAWCFAPPRGERRNLG